jgi:hypothetical protein
MDAEVALLSGHAVSGPIVGAGLLGVILAGLVFLFSGDLGGEIEQSRKAALDPEVWNSVTSARSQSLYTFLCAD